MGKAVEREQLLAAAAASHSRDECGDLVVLRLAIYSGLRAYTCGFMNAVNRIDEVHDADGKKGREGGGGGLFMNLSEEIPHFSLGLKL